MLQETKKVTQTLYSVACVIIINTVIMIIIKNFSTVTQHVKFKFRLSNKIRIINILMLLTLQGIKMFKQIIFKDSFRTAQ